MPMMIGAIDLPIRIIVELAGVTSNCSNVPFSLSLAIAKEASMII